VNIQIESSATVLVSSAATEALLRLAELRLAAIRLEYTQIAQRHGWIDLQLLNKRSS
jgi:hypothetical protein